MKRMAAAVLVGVTVGAATFASASALTVNSAARLGAGSTLAASCDTTGVGTSFTTGFDATAGYTVTAVQVSGIDSPSCDGKSVSVTLADGSDNALGSGGPVTVATSGTSVTATINGTVAASRVGRIYVVIT